MKYLNILLFCSISLSSFGQGFHELISEGDKMYDQGAYLQSAQLYDAAFELDEGSATQYYNAACSWALSGDTIHSIKYLALAAEKGWTNVDHLQSDSDLNSLHDVLGWDGVVDMVQSNLDEYEKDFNKPLKAQLEAIYVRDQTLRQLYREAEEKFGAESDEMDYFWGLMSQQDNLNELEVESIIETHGWVGRSEVGGKANMTLWLVIQHAPLETQEKYLPLLKESVMDGESSGNHLALLQDRILMRQGKAQIYGSQIVSDPETGGQKVYEVEDPEKINERRAEVGLGPIEDYTRRFGIEWNE
jgi:tetratricopeptide (TPR) repeat protein